MIKELCKQAQNTGFNIALCVMDGDTGSHSAVLECFPKAEIAHCANHHSKNFYIYLKNISTLKCSCRPNCTRITNALILKMQKTFQTAMASSQTTNDFLMLMNNFPEHYSNNHANCTFHPKEVDGKPYSSPIFFDCLVQKSALEKLVHTMAENPEEFISTSGPVTTNIAEGFHGLALMYRDKKAPLKARHYKVKTDMAFLHKNIGPKWKLEFLKRVKVPVSIASQKFINEEQTAFENGKEVAQTPESKKRRAEKRRNLKLRRNESNRVDEISQDLGENIVFYESQSTLMDGVGGDQIGEDKEENESKEKRDQDEDLKEEQKDLEDINEDALVKLNDPLLVGLDFETTGRDPKRDKIIQISMAVHGETTENSFTKYIFTHFPISKGGNSFFLSLS